MFLTLAAFVSVIHSRCLPRGLLASVQRLAQSCQAPVGLFTVDGVQERLTMSRQLGADVTINFIDEDPAAAILETHIASGYFRIRTV
jgi:hypothetical protein